MNAAPPTDRASVSWLHQAGGDFDRGELIEAHGVKPGEAHRGPAALAGADAVAHGECLLRHGRGPRPCRRLRFARCFPSR